MQTSRKIYLDFLRIVSAIAVISIHLRTASGLSVWQESVTILSSVCMQWSVPVFIMISGTLFLDPKREITIAGLYKKNVLKIAVIFAFWSVLYALVAAIQFSEKNAVSFIKAFLSDAAAGHYHMWYLVMLLGLYAATPLIRACLGKDGKLLKYWLALCFVAVPLFTVAEQFPLIESVFSGNFKLVNPGLASKYIMYYLLGYYFSVTELSKRKRKIIYALAFASLIFTCAGTTLLSLKAGELKTTLANNALPNQIFFASAIYVFAKNFFEKRTLSERNTKNLTTVSSCTLGVYLIHPLLIENFFAPAPCGFAMALLGIPLRINLAFCLSLAIVLLLKFAAKRVKFLRFINYLI